jgi:ankyrin repeat protein
VDCLKLMINNHADVNAAEVDGKTPLCRASRVGSIKCVQALLKAKVDLDPRGPTEEGKDHHRCCCGCRTSAGARASSRSSTKQRSTALARVLSSRSSRKRVRSR